ncbi:MAG: hypothetical protein ACI4I1_12745, partial [Oscillospiraceae bacterium]
GESEGGESEGGESEGGESEEKPAPTPTPTPAPSTNTGSNTSSGSSITPAPAGYTPAPVEVSDSGSVAYAAKAASTNATITLSGDAASKGVTSETASVLYGKKNVKVKVVSGTSFFVVNSNDIASKDAKADLDIAVKSGDGKAKIVVGGEIKGVSSVILRVKINGFNDEKVVIKANGKIIATAIVHSGKLAFRLPAEYVGQEISVEAK